MLLKLLAALCGHKETGAMAIRVKVDFITPSMLLVVSIYWSMLLQVLTRACALGLFVAC